MDLQLALSRFRRLRDQSPKKGCGVSQDFRSLSRSCFTHRRRRRTALSSPPDILLRREGHSATHYFAHNPVIFQILARRILDRMWFPCVNRPGFHTTRPDSHWLMEQFIPFDYANQSTDEDYAARKTYRLAGWRLRVVPPELAPVSSGSRRLPD